MSSDHTPETAEIQLTRGKVALIDDCDSDLFVFKWSAVSPGGRFYAIRSYKLNGATKYIYLHRAILERMLNRSLIKGEVCDHINNNPLDNRRCNLRVCTHQQNIINSKKHIDNTSGYKGISWCKSHKKWQVKISENGKQKMIGRFSNIQDAIQAYKQSAVNHYGEFARFE